MGTLTGGAGGSGLRLSLQALEDGGPAADEILVSRGEVRGGRGVPPALVPSPVFVIGVFPGQTGQWLQVDWEAPGQNIFVSAAGSPQLADTGIFVIWFLFPPQERGRF